MIYIAQSLSRTAKEQSYVGFGLTHPLGNLSVFHFLKMEQTESLSLLRGQIRQKALQNFALIMQCRHLVGCQSVFFFFLTNHCECLIIQTHIVAVASQVDANVSYRRNKIASSLLGRKRGQKLTSLPNGNECVLHGILSLRIIVEHRPRNAVKLCAACEIVMLQFV